MDLLSRLLFVLGLGFLGANLLFVARFVRFLRLRSTAILTWPAERPPMYGLLLGLGAILSVLIAYKLAVLKLHPRQVFGETMMLVYYGYAVPLSVKINPGFYQEGIWADSGFVFLRQQGEVGS